VGCEFFEVFFVGGVDGLSLHCYSWFLVEKKGDDTCFHKDTVAVSTWNHAGHVKENDYLTPKQTQKNVVNPKQDADCKQSCGNSKTAPPT
jgi:hypothetical protein